MAKLKGIDHFDAKIKAPCNLNTNHKITNHEQNFEKNVIIWQFLFLDFSINAQGFCNNGGLMIPNGLMLQPL